MYDYLKVYLRERYQEKGVKTPLEAWCNNIFDPVCKAEIQKAEENMGRSFPSELRKFYEEIGYGNLTTPHMPPKDHHCYAANVILPPSSAVCFFNGQLVDEFDDYYMSQDFYDDLDPGDLPFFEISDSSSFMVMKLNSKNPNAVWYMGYEKIEDSLEKFIWKLYYEGPEYYTKNW